MFSKRQAFILIKLAVYQNVLFLIYSFIHPKFTTSNFYYFPLVLFVYYIFEFSLRRIIRGNKSESDGCWLNLLLFLIKFFLCLCTLVYSMSGTNMNRPDTVLHDSLWLFTEIVFATLFIYPMLFVADSIKPKSESEIFGQDSEINFINFKQLALLIIVGLIELAIINIYGKFRSTLNYMPPGILIPIFMLASRLFTYDLIVSKKLKDSSYTITIITLINSYYTMISFGLTSYLVFANFQLLFDVNMMIVTVILYTITEIILGMFSDHSSQNKHSSIEAPKGFQNVNQNSSIDSKSDGVTK